MFVHVCVGVVQDEERLIEERKRKRQRILEEHRKREAELKVRHLYRYVSI
jgi:hypothetical protein